MITINIEGRVYQFLNFTEILQILDLLRRYQNEQLAYHQQLLGGTKSLTQTHEKLKSN